MGVRKVSRNRFTPPLPIDLGQLRSWHEAYFPSRHAGVSSDAVGRVFGGAELP